MKAASAPRRDAAENEILRGANALFESGSVVELRILGNRNGRGPTIAGYFDDFRKLAQAAARHSGQHGIEGLYWTLNPCKQALLARCVNRVSNLKDTTSDRDILKRVSLLIDCDPARPKGISATDQEKALAKATAERVRDYLTHEGWPGPFFADSGNGYHLIYRIDLPNDDAARDSIKACLEALAAQFDSDAVKIDTSVFNAARICKVYGSVAAKGDSTADRPHRIAHLIEEPKSSVPVNKELLETLAAKAPKQRSRANSRTAGIAPEKVEEFLAASGISHRKRVPWEGGWKWVLENCWFDESHKATSVFVGIGGTGALVYHCSHTSCGGYRWQQFRESVEQKLGRKFYFEDAANSKAAAQGPSPWSRVEGMDAFLAEEEAPVASLHPPLIYKECITEVFSPRGLGKSLWMLFVAILLAVKGFKILLIDRDNPRRELKARLRSFGATRELAGLEVISRENAPPLTNTRAWEEFPYLDYDLVIVDSLDSTTEGVGEQDSAKPSRAFAPLLDIAHRENGPAVLVLGNCVKAGTHSRGSGVTEDRADIVFEVRDCTNFHPSGKKPWVEELPAADAGSWASRSSRRKKQTKLRLAFIPTKFRVGEEPEPFVIELNLADEPWTVDDVTDLVDLEGKAERERCAKEHAETLARARKALIAEILRRQAASEPVMLKDKDAVPFLTKQHSLKQKAARALVNDPQGQWELRKIEHMPGHPVGVFPSSPGEKEDSVNGNTTPQKQAKNAGLDQAHFRCPRPQQSTEIPPSQVADKKEDAPPPISVKAANLTTPCEAVADVQNAPQTDAEEVLL